MDDLTRLLQEKEPMWTTELQDWVLVRRDWGEAGIRYSIFNDTEGTSLRICHEMLHNEVTARMLAAGVRILDHPPFSWMLGRDLTQEEREILKGGHRAPGAAQILLDREPSELDLKVLDDIYGPKVRHEPPPAS